MSLDRILNIKINGLFVKLARMEERFMAIMDDLAAQTAKNTDVIESAIVLINGLAQKLQEALASATPIEAVQAVIDNMKAEDDKLATAVAAQTPAEVPTS
jgi:hypothetical protein